MHHKTLVTALLASSAIAAPSDLSRREVSLVTLHANDVDDAYNAEASTTLKSRQPWSSVQLNTTDADTDLRCQLIDWDEQPIPLQRGNAVDRTFGDGGNGKWTFAAGDEYVRKIVCDPAFKKIVARGRAVEVIIHADAGGNVRKHFVDGRRHEVEPVEEHRSFSGVELNIGPLAWNQDLRCQLVDTDGEAVMVEREGLHSFTFGDDSKGPWKFATPHRRIKDITCDAEFEYTKIV